MRSCSPESIGKRISDCRKEYGKRTGKKLTQEVFAKQIGYSREQVAKWERGLQSLTPEQLDIIASFFDVSIDYLVTGVDASNRTVAEALGLDESSITFLRELEESKNDYQESLIDISAEWMVTDKPVSNPERPVLQGYVSDELQFIINWLLSHSRGQRLLTWISKYCSISGTDAYMLDDYNPELLETYTKCDMLHFRNGSGWTMVNPAVIINGMLYTITTELSECRNDIQNGK